MRGDPEDKSKTQQARAKDLINCVSVSHCCITNIIINNLSVKQQ